MIKKTSKMATILLGALIVLGLLLGPAQADLSPYQRGNNYNTFFSDPNTFADARVNFQIFQQWRPGAIGDTTHYTFSFSPGYYNASWVGGTDIGVSNFVTGLDSVSADLTALTGNVGATLLKTSLNASSSFPLKVGVSGGYYFLEESFSSSGGVNDGGYYYWQMKIPGDWSAVGTGPGQYELLTVNSLWTIIDNFYYSPGEDTTFFLANIDPYYNDGAHNIDIDFILHGGPVPLPPSVLMFGSGLLGLAGLAWRRRKV